MSKIIFKWFLPWNFEKKEAWLNQMSFNELNLCDVGFLTYTFEKCQPEEYQYKVEIFNEDPSSEKMMNYIATLCSSGVEYIGNVGSWNFFKKKTSQGDFNLFDTADARIKHLKTIFRWLIYTLAAETLIGSTYIVRLISSIMNHHLDIIILLFGILLVWIYLTLGMGLYKIGKKLKDFS